jgi:alpha-1,6-mannosyltransferase
MNPAPSWLAAPADGVSSHPVSRLWLLVAGICLPAIGFAWRYPLRGNEQQLTDIGKLAAYGREEFAGYVGGLALMFACYLLAIRESRRLSARQALPSVVVGAVVLALVMATMYPVNAIDLFLYTVRSRLLTGHGVNPLTALPMDYPGDPLMRFASREWADDVSPYGPLWNLIAAPVTAISGDRILPALIGFKTLAVASVLATGWVIARAVAATRPEEATTAALIFLWNPLVLWEGIGNGHNDVVMTLPLLLALLAWTRRHDRWVVPWLVVAALIKYVTVLLLPLAAVALWRRTEGRAARRQLILWSGALTMIAAVIAFFPFYNLQAVRESVANQGNIFLTSPAALVVGELRDRYAVDDLKHWCRVIGQSTLLLAVIGLMLWLWKRPDRLPRAAFEAIYLFLLVATWNFRGWYLVWPVAVAALLPWGWPSWRIISWTAGALAGYGLFIWGWEWWGTDFLTVQKAGVALMTGPTVLLSLTELVIEARARGRDRGEENATPDELGLPTRVHD